MGYTVSTQDNDLLNISYTKLHFQLYLKNTESNKFDFLKSSVLKKSIIYMLSNCRKTYKRENSVRNIE